MAIFLSFFAAVIIFSGVLLVEIIRSEKRAQSQGYGPESHTGLEPCGQGRLDCVSYKAPTLGKSISFGYALRLYSGHGDVTGTFEYASRAAEFHDTIYSGSLFLSFSEGRVKGRSLMGGLQCAEGVVGQGGARLTRGHPKGGILGILNGPYEYSVRGGKVHFDITTRAGNISKDSELTIADGRIAGRVFHGPQKTWAVDVDVAYSDIQAEAATLAIVLACDHILRVHHGD